MAKLEIIGSLDLGQVAYGPVPASLMQIGRVTVEAFRYRSGVAALRVLNGVGEVVILPFHGQQIWDVQFHGRRLTMASMFDEPQQSRVYVENYGTFFLHCGATAMGIPGPEDTHKLHGELPNAQYQEASLAFWQEDGRTVIEISGGYEHREAFGHHYLFRPALKIVEGSGQMDLHVELTNLRHSPMAFMYLAHANFRPIDGARIVDSVPDGPDSQRVAPRVPFASGCNEPDDFVALRTRPERHRDVVPGPLDVLIGLDCEAGKDGWFSAMQTIPGGGADFISFRPEQLGSAIRWITRNGDEDALGLVLPGTAEVGGLAAARRQGKLVTLAPRQSFSADIRLGALTPEEAATMDKTIVRRDWWF